MKSDVDVEHLLEDDHTLSPPTSCTSSSSSSYYHTSIHALSSQPSSSYSSLNLASWSATQSDHQISRITPARRVNELKDEVKYMLERQRLIRRDVYEYDAHSRSGIDLRYDLITICRTFLGDDNISPYLTPYESVSHQLEMLKFPQRDIIDKGAVQSYLQSIMKIKRALSHSEEFPPVEIVIKADPQDVLVGESHV